MDTTKITKYFGDSYQRCKNDENFFAIFYETFLASSEEVREKFKNTDFKVQTQLLKVSLPLIMLACGKKRARLRTS